MPLSGVWVEAMKRRSRAGGKAAKARPRKALNRKPRKASKAVTHRGSASAGPTEVARLTRERDEALEQLTATSEVLQVISRSPGELEPVLEKAVRICDCTFGNIYRLDGDTLHLVAAHNTPPAFAEFRRRSPLRTSPQDAIGRALATKTPVHVADLSTQRPTLTMRDTSLLPNSEVCGRI
jgi:hypothetical protein